VSLCFSTGQHPDPVDEAELLRNFVGREYSPQTPAQSAMIDFGIGGNHDIGY
jgi:hypothetical protein